jgi:hypothetical protein
VILANGTTDVTTYFVLRNSTTHAPDTTVTVTDIDLYYAEQGGALSVKADAVALALATTAHTDHGAFHLGDGLYRIDWPDAAFDGGIGKVVILMVVCAGVDTTFLDVELSPSVNVASQNSTVVSGGSSAIGISGGSGGVFFESLYSDRLDYELGTNDSAVLFTTERRKASVNEGLREFADLTQCWTRESTIGIVTGQASYNLHSTVNIPNEDFLRVTAEGPAYRHTDASGSLTVLAGDSFPRRQEPWLNAASPGWQGSTGTGHPTEWFLTPQDGALSLQLNPPPQVSTGCAAVIRLPYVARPSSLVSTGAVPFTDTAGLTRRDLRPYHQALVHYAASRLELLRKDREASDRQLQKFLGYVQRYLQAGRQPAGQTIRPARSYFTRAHGRRDDDVGARAPWWR